MVVDYDKIQKTINDLPKDSSDNLSYAENFNKYWYKSRKLYFDFIAEECEYPNGLQNINIKVLKYHPLLIECIYDSTKSIYEHGAWYLLPAKKLLNIILVDANLPKNFGSEYSHVNLTIKKTLFGNNRIVKITGNKISLKIKCTKVELSKTATYIQDDGGWVIYKK